MTNPETIALSATALYSSVLAGLAIRRQRRLKGLRERIRRFQPIRGYSANACEQELREIEDSDDVLNVVVPKLDELSRKAPEPALGLAIETRLSYNEQFVSSATDSTETRLRPELRTEFREGVAALRGSWADLDKAGVYLELAKTFHKLSCYRVPVWNPEEIPPAVEALKRAGERMRDGDYTALLDFHSDYAQQGWPDPLVDFAFDTLGLTMWNIERGTGPDYARLESFAREVARPTVSLAESLRTGDTRAIAHDLHDYFSVAAKFEDA